MIFQLDCNMSREQAEACIETFERAVCVSANQHPLTASPDGGERGTYQIVLDTDKIQHQPNEYGDPIDALLYAMSLILYEAQR